MRARLLSNLSSAVVLAASLVAVAVATTANAAPGPFAELGGTWRGDGTVLYSDGSRESLHCRADYNVAMDGNALSQSMRCATPSYSFRITADIRHAGGALSGQWNEVSRNLRGEISGQATAGSLQASVQGPQLAATVSVTTRGNQQIVAIHSPGSTATEVAIQLRRQG